MRKNCKLCNIILDNTNHRKHDGHNCKACVANARKIYKKLPHVAERRKFWNRSRYAKNPLRYRNNLRCFLSCCLGTIKRHHPECDLDLEFIVKLYNSQNGKSAITQVKMTHVWHSLYSVSIDRINRSIGHIKNNIQLVCKVENLGKNIHSNQEFLDYLNTYVNVFKGKQLMENQDAY